MNSDFSGRPSRIPPSLAELTDQLQKAGVDTQALRNDLTDAIASIRRYATPAAPSPFALSKAAVTAATRGCFLPSDLAPQDRMGTTPEIDGLLAQSDVMSSGVQRAWQLRTPIRRDILLQANAAGMLHDAVAQLASPLDPRDGEGPLLRRALAGEPLDPDGMSLDELQQLATVAAWLDGTKLGKTPPPDEVRRLIGLREVLDPFRTLVGRTAKAGSDGTNDRVVGRVEEMERLRAYVGVVKPEELRFYATRTLSSLWSTVTFSDDANEPLLIKGIGGMGKSTLIAKFVLDHALFPGVALPFVYLDFDRAALAPRQPLQLLIEVAAQLGLRFPAMEEKLKDLRTHLREVIDSQGRNQNRRQREGATGSELKGHCETLRKIVEDVNRQNAPVLMLFDTFEVVQYDDEAVRGVKALLAALRQPDGPPWDNLRIVVAGRGDLSDDIVTSHDPVDLRQLSLRATSELLTRRSRSENLGLTDAQIKTLAPTLRNSPLDVIVVTNWLRDRQPQERPALVEDLVKGIDDDVRAEPRGTPERSAPRVTGILTQRMIKHINDRDVQALANPGLVVRVVTPQIIREVMAPASALSSSEKPLPAGAEDELYRRLERERWLVTRQGKFLRHRPEVRRAMLDLMRIENRERFDRTNDLALQAFRKRAEEDNEDDEARAEAIYHLLLGGHAPLEEADALWRPSCGTPLSSAVDDLDARGRGYLTAKLGRSVPVETLASFSAKVLLPLLASFGLNYLRGLGANALLGVLRSVEGVFDAPSISGLRHEALYRVGAWDALRDSAAAGANAGSPGVASEMLWQGNFEQLKASDQSALTALRFLLRWATRDPAADGLWKHRYAHFADISFDPVRVLELPSLCWDFATLVACAGSRGAFTPGQRNAIMARTGELCRTQAPLPDAAAGSDALRVLTFFETVADRPILRRVDFDNHFATVSGREVRDFRNLIQFPVGEPPASVKEALERGRALLIQFSQFKDNVVIADRTITREFASVVRTLTNLPDNNRTRAVLHTLSHKHPDWLQPLGSALTRAFDGNVPRRIGWWSSIEKYFGSGEQPRRATENADGQQLLSLADEASSLPEAVAAYAKLLESKGADPAAQRFLAMAQAFSAWTRMIERTLDEPTVG